MKVTGAIVVSSRGKIRHLLPLTVLKPKQIIVMHVSILRVTIPPGQPRGQVQPFRPGGGELFEAVLSRGEGGGAKKNYFLLFL